jgi:molecular chaperone GrpE
MHPKSAEVHQDPEQAAPDLNAPDPSPAGEDEVAGSEEAGAIAALEDRLRRALADLENLRKRHARELGRQRAAEANRLAAAWLPVVDNLDLALSYADADPSAIIDGVQKVRDQALAVLADLGFSRHDEVGVPFDPAQHEVVNVVDDSDAEPGTVVRVLRPGYGTAERQLRPGAVTVAGRRG